MEAKVLLNSIDKVKAFVGITRTTSFDIDLFNNTDSCLDAKSILGILSCDINQPLSIFIHSDNCNGFLEQISSFIV